MNTVKFNVPMNPYDDDAKLFARSAVEINSGLTVLVGCNGSGKSTLLGLIRSQVAERPAALVVEYNDRTSGGTNRIGELIFRGDIEHAAGMMCSSEGERIHQSAGILFSRLGHDIRQRRPKEVWVLMDAVSSGLSIDNAVEIKDFVEFVQAEEPGIDFYFIVSTNEYEFAAGANCIDVTTFRHKTFKTYAAYRKFILATREKKNRRYKQAMSE